MPLDLGFPLSMVGEDPELTGDPTGSNLLELGHIDWLVDKKGVFVATWQVRQSERYST